MRLRKTQGKDIKAIFLWLMALTGLALLSNCEENPNPIALQDRNSEIISDTLYCKFDTTRALDKVITTINSDRLLLGTQQNYNFRVIFRFSFAGLTDTLDVDSAWVRFVSLGPKSNKNSIGMEFTATGYLPLEDWLADTSKVWENYPANVDFSKPVGEMRVTNLPEDTTLFRFNKLGMDAVRRWAGAADSLFYYKIKNYGIVLDFTSATFLKEFQGRSTTENKGIYLFIADTISTDSVVTDSVVIDSFQAVTDAFLIEGTFQPVPNRDHTATLTPWVTLLDFDLDTLKQIYQGGLIITSANLQLPVDWANTLTHSDFGPNLQLFPLTSSLTDSGIVIDSTFLGIPSLIIDLNRYSEDSTYVQVTDGTERQEFAANYIQRKLNFPDVYKGFYIENKFQDQYLANFSFFKYNSPDPARRPRLIIQLLKLPDERL